MLNVYFTGTFKRDYKRAIKRGCPKSEFIAVVDLLKNEQPLPEKYRDHALNGNYAGFRECHIQPDWLLIYQVDKGRLVLTLSRTGTHADLF